MEFRKERKSPPSSLPVDYLKMVREVFQTNYAAQLEAFGKIVCDPYFEAHGEISENEIVLAVSLHSKGQLAATTVTASVDFDPNSELQKSELLLGFCSDAIGTLYEGLFDQSKNPRALENLAEKSLSALEDVPFDWSSYPIEKTKVFLKIDKSNLSLDRLADRWLAENDPQVREAEQESEAEVKSRFITGSTSIH